LRVRDRQIESLTQRLAAQEAETLATQGIAVDGFTVVARRIAADNVDFLYTTADAVRSRIGRGIVVLGSVVGGRAAFTMTVTRDLNEQGYQANTLLSEAAKEAEARAGGSPQFARGGGGDASKLDRVLETAVTLIRKKAES
jgi:alanyl-tRNA synthetase